MKYLTITVPCLGYKDCCECVDLREIRIKHPKLASYMCRNVSVMMAISSIHLLLSGNVKAKTRHWEIWADLKNENSGQCLIASMCITRGISFYFIMIVSFGVWGIAYLKNNRKSE